MTQPEEEILIIKDDDEQVPEISTHRAFLYSLAFPGWGEKYAGAFSRSSLTGALLFFFVILLFYSFYDFFSGVATVFTSAAKGVNARQMTDKANSVQSSVIYLIIAIFGIYFVWLWGIISSIEVGRARRLKDGLKAEESPLWAIAMNYLCPGSGHVYVGDKSWGHCLFGACLLGTLLIVPSGIEFMEQIRTLGDKGLGPQGIIREARNLQALLTFGIGTLIGLAVQALAIAEVSSALSKQFCTQYEKKRPVRLFLLALINYVCPGAAQILVSRETIGFQIVYTYVGVRLAIGLLLGMEIITPGQANLAAWLSTIIQWSAMVETPVRELIEEPTNSKGEQSVQSEA